MRDLTCEECGKEFMSEQFRKHCTLECRKAAKKKRPSHRRQQKGTKMTSAERITRRLERMENNIEDLTEAVGVIMHSLDEIGKYLGQVPMATTQMLLQSLQIMRDTPVGEEEE